MPLYEYACPNGHYQERIFAVKDRAAVIDCEQCDMLAERILSMPVVQTIATHLRGTDLCDGQGYLDHNLRDRRTGKVPYITSLGQKQKLLKERKLFEYGPDTQDRRADEDRSRKRKVFS